MNATATIVFLSMFGLCAPALSATVYESDCGQNSERIAESDVSLPERLVALEELGKACRGSGVYELRLGVLYTRAEQFQKARAILAAGSAIESPYQKNLRLALSDIDFRQGNIEASERQALSLVQDFPDWSGGYVALAEGFLVQRRFGEAILNLEKANDLQQSGGTFVLLTMAYYQERRFRESAVAMQRALKLDRNGLKHTEAVCAAAYSLVELGHLAAAADLLEKHRQVQPEAERSKTYREAVALVAKRLAALPKS